MRALSTLSFPALAVFEMMISSGKGLDPHLYLCSSLHTESQWKPRIKWGGNDAFASSGNGGQSQPKARLQQSCSVTTPVCNNFGFGPRGIARGKDQIWFMPIISTLTLKWWWVAVLLMCPVPQESQPLSCEMHPACFCECCWTRQIRSSHFMTSANMFKTREKST